MIIEALDKSETSEMHILVIIRWSITIDHRIERVLISIKQSQNLASITIEINSKKDVFWQVFPNIFLPKTVSENVRNITYLAVEIANKCWDESARNQ